MRDFGSLNEISPIEIKSFEIISGELKDRGIVLDGEKAPVIMRCIHTTADFDYVDTLTFSHNAIGILTELIRAGATIITDTNMALAGINKSELAKYNARACCFMAEPEIMAAAKDRGVTRACASMEYASAIEGPKVFVIGNAPTALMSLCDIMDRSDFVPDFVVGVPVGFVNVESAKEMIINRDVNYIVNRGRKGGSNVAACIINAILYGIRDGAV